MAKSECEKKVELINATILLDETFSELIARYFSSVSKQDLLNKTIIQNLKISKKKDIIKSILRQYPQEIRDIDDWCKCAVRCIAIRNKIAHKLSKNSLYEITLDGKLGNYNVTQLLKKFKDSWKILKPPIDKILNKLKDDNLLEDVVVVRVYMRNFKGWFNDIHQVQVENSNAEEMELDDYPEKQYDINKYKREVKKDIKEWLVDKGINMFNVDIEVERDWYEEPND